MQINYKSGGFFKIKRVKCDNTANGQMFLDYAILIESILDQKL